MKIYLGADHRGFELKNKLVEWLKGEEYEVEDCGNTMLDPVDDYVDFANKVATSVIASRMPAEKQSQEIAASSSTPRNDTALATGIVICGSGIGVSIAANRHKGIICGLGFDTHQIQHARENDHINMLSLPSDYVSFEKAKEIVTAFLQSKPKMDEKYVRRAKKLDETS